MKINKRWTVIATVLGTAATIGGIKYKEHVDFWAYAETCSESRDLRRQAAGQMGKYVMSGMSDLAAQAAVVLRDASDLVEQCNADGL